MRISMLAAISFVACQSGASGNATDGGATGAAHGGLIQVLASSSSLGFAEANFFTVSASSSCEQSTVGGCAITRCTSTNADLSASPDLGTAPDLGTVINPNAGTITITGATSTPIALKTKADGSYLSFAAAALLLAGGDSLAVSAPGDVVPALTGSLTAPSQIALAAPSVPAGGAPLDLTSSVTFTWTPAGVGQLVLTFHYVAAGVDDTATCRADASAGTLTVSPSTFTGFSGEGIFMATTENSVLISDGDYPTHFVASIFSLDRTSGSPYAGAAKFQ